MDLVAFEKNKIKNQAGNNSGGKVLHALLPPILPCVSQPPAAERERSPKWFPKPYTVSYLHSGAHSRCDVERERERKAELTERDPLE